MENSEVKHGLNKLSAWLKDKRWNLMRLSTVVDEINFDERLITNRTTGTVEHQLYSLLHECGHLTLGRPILERLGSATPREKLSRTYLVMRAVNEARAWDAGERLASRLNIAYNPRAYEKYRSIYLVKYFLAACRSNSVKTTNLVYIK